MTAAEAMRHGRLGCRRNAETERTMMEAALDVTVKLLLELHIPIMVSAHSKRNTSRPVFTAHERALAKSHWSSSSARLHRDSFLPFGSCGLCLNIARDPVSCRRGDIFCRECALSNILAQKKDIKRTQKARAVADEEAAKLKAYEDEQEQARAVQDFELTQAGLDRKKKGHATKTSDEKPSAMADESNALALVPATKRKFELDQDELDRIAHEDKTKARKALEEEKAAKPHLPSFWTPSLTPDAQSSKLPPVTKKDKTVPTCPASSTENTHPITMQNLITINFTEEETPKGKQRACPSCLKMLTNASHPMMAKQCGHVLCHSCVKQFMVPPAKKPCAEDDPPLTCYVCDVPLTSKSQKQDVASGSSIPGLVALQSEGTGFSAHGGNTVERSSVAFQC
ncbi:nitric oxide synthase-interacting [Fusarium longipes]|uniref:Nitric oxide synthase-interacting n=1 Tax=Fusarium longipes TaxID=694270 RepID=A0A395SBG5_9HYPO|nr:nitric oxide synthase-interacting [Fusarium longipes]